MKAPIVVAAGGTGGHVIPALAVAEVLRDKGVPVVWIGTQAGLESRLVPDNDIRIYWISVAGLRGKRWLAKLTGPFQVLRSCLQSLRLLNKIKPRAVLGMGGFVSGPVGLAAFLYRTPLVLHEQNAVAGLTNRYLRPLAKRVFCAWPGAFADQDAVQVIGNPIRADIAALSARLDTSRAAHEQTLSILIVGGSRGARALNEKIPAALTALDRPVTVLHQTGTQDLQRVLSAYAEAPRLKATVVEFIDDMASAYADADLVICRSGAMTVTELSAIGMPAILVPFPFAVDDHQTLNARQLSDRGAAWLIQESQLNDQVLADILNPVIEDRSVLESMSDAARTCFNPTAAQQVAEALLEISA